MLCISFLVSKALSVADPLRNALMGVINASLWDRRKTFLPLFLPDAAWMRIRFLVALLIKLLLLINSNGIFTALYQLEDACIREIAASGVE